MTKTLAAAAGVFSLLFVPLGAASTGSVAGSVAAPGLTSVKGIVVSLDAAGLKATPPKAPVVIDQRNLHFAPRVVAVVKGTTVKWLNDDTVEHNVFSPQGGYDLGSWGPGQSRTHTFTKPGVYTQLCRLHTEMEGYVVVLDTPYYAVTGDAGTFDIKDVPPGRYTLKAWGGPKETATRPVTVEGGKPATVQVTLGH